MQNCTRLEYISQTKPGSCTAKKQEFYLEKRKNNGKRQKNGKPSSFQRFFLIGKMPVLNKYRNRNKRKTHSVCTFA